MIFRRKPSDAKKNGSKTATAAYSHGPDLNPSRSPLDTKLYRQIMLSNGLRAVLISDTVALQRQGSANQCYDSDSSEHGGNDSIEKDDNGSEYTDSDEGGSGLRDAAAAIVVGAGSMYEPMECQGLAHFLEHLLFMGSKKYPKENDYEAFISKHGGTDNAYTEWEYTVYNLSISQQEYLWQALDRLAQFFIEPLLLESAVERELKAIESEFQLNKQNGQVRWQQLMCSTAVKSHPLAKFAWGNVQSLSYIPKNVHKVDPMIKLREFYNTYYYASNMRLVVMGAYTLDEMEKQIVSIFSTIPALPRNVDLKNGQRDESLSLPVDPENYTSWDAKYDALSRNAGMPLGPDTIGKIYRILPVKDRHSLKMTFQLPPLIDYWRCKPVDFVSHLIGHEARGSLLSYFRKTPEKSWVTACMAGINEEGSEFASSHALFSILFQLSDEGINHWQEIIDTTFAYIGMLQYYSKVQGWPEHLYEEVRRVHELSYRYGDEQSPEDTVESIITDMAPHWNLPPERLLDGSHLVWEFDPDVIQTHVLDYLHPDNMHIDMSSTTFGRPTDYSDEVAKVVAETKETLLGDIVSLTETGSFDAEAAGKPNIEPMFGTLFWCYEIPADLKEKWIGMREPKDTDLPLHLPDPNPYVPSCFDLKSLPEDDADHPLLNSSIKLCITVGRKKQWFPATVLRYNSKKNSLLVQYEDNEEKWHIPDLKPSDYTADILVPDYESTMDDKKVRFKVVALSRPGQGPLRMFGDESDFEVAEGSKFPMIPPEMPKERLPKLICDNNKLKLWYLQDRNYRRPIADLRLQLNCINANKSPLHRACAELVASMVADACLETAYLASLCELGSHIEVTDTGLYLRFCGFDHKLLGLAERVLKCLLSFCGSRDTLPQEFTKERFDACLEILQRRYRNSCMSSSQMASSIRLQALRQTKWAARAKAKAIAALEIPDFVNIASSLFESFAIESLLHGNVDLEDAKTTRDLLSNLASCGENSGLARKKYPLQSVTRIPSVSSPSLITVPAKDVEEANTAVEFYIQIGKDNDEDRMMIDLLIYLMDEPMYDQLRTKDQFGYDVSCDVRWTYGITGIIFLVVTNVKSAEETMARFDKFIVDYREALVKMSDKEFMEHVVGLATQKLDMFNSLSEETDCYWAEIRDGRFDWQAWRNETKLLQRVTKKDVLDAYDRWLLPSKKRACMGIQVIGYGDTDAGSGRPQVKDREDSIELYCEEQVQAFHKLCKGQTWGKINSKLF